MKSISFGFPSERPTSWVDFLVVPLLAPVVLFLIDAYLSPQAFLLPLMLVMTLSYLALRLPVIAVASWAVVYIVIVLVVSSYQLESTQTLPALKPYLRTAFIMTGGIMACLLASHRMRLQNSNRALSKVISVLPLAVVVSDITGNILLMNPAAERLLQGHLDELSGRSFFSTFIGQEERSWGTAQYLGYFGSEEAGPFSTVLHMQGERPLTLDVSITIVTMDQTPYAVTVIEKAEAEVPALPAQLPMRAAHQAPV